MQTAGSAGESIAFGVGVTMPALMILGFEMDIGRVMVVAVLGGLLGILMMIPLRRAYIVRQHRTLKYPEGTACADVLIVGEQGGATAKTVFAGFGVAAGLSVSLMERDEALEGGAVARICLVQRGGAVDRSESGAAGRRLHHRHANLLRDGRRRRVGVAGVCPGDSFLRRLARQAASPLRARNSSAR